MDSNSCYKCGEAVVQGDDYKIHLSIAHGVKYTDSETVIRKTPTKSINAKITSNKVATSISKKEESTKNVIETFDAQMKQIMDVAEGKVKPMMIKDKNVKDHDAEEIWQMFEDIKAKVMSIDVSNKIDMKKNESVIDNFDSSLVPAQLDIPHEPAPQVERKWYQGTYYKCKECKNILYGQDFFKKHLRSHSIQVKTFKDLSGFAEQYEEKLYACKVCKREIKHEFKNIHSHLKTVHSLTMFDYEYQFRNESYVVKDDNSDIASSNIKLTTDLYPQVKTNPDQRNIVAPKTSQDTSSKFQDSEEGPSVERKTVQSISGNISEVLNSELSNIYPPTISVLHHAPPDTQKIPVSLTNTNPDHDKLMASPNDVQQVKKEQPVNATPKTTSFYYCPFKDCPFYATKEGMKKGLAALHLKDDHQIRAKDMKPGMYKFEKVKV